MFEIKSNNIRYLRDLTTLDTHKGFEEQFNDIAAQLLSNFRVRIKNHLYKMNEIEFYYYCPKKHPDPYVHRHDDQTKKACWYFHRKEGSFKGLDITFGDGPCYGGILIRSLESLDNSHCASGPSKVVDEILMLHGHKKVKEMLNSEIELCLDVATDRTPIKELYRGKRVGLKIKKEDSDGYFINRNYRFCASLLNVKKDKKGLIK